MIYDTLSWPSYEGTGISLDALGPLVFLKLKYSFMEKKSVRIEDFREVTQFARVEPSTCYGSACEGLFLLMP